MELGALVCAPKGPACGECPIARECRARSEGREGELPQVGKKKAPLAVEKAALVFVAKDRVLLGRRAREGLFGGMWEPPQIDRSQADPRAEFSRLVGARVPELEAKGAVTHVLTHRRMQIEVLRADARGRTPAVRKDSAPPYDAFEFAPLTAGARGLSTLARKVLACGGIEPADG